MDNNQVNNNINNDMNNNQINNNQVNNDRVENERKGRGLFYGVIAIAVFIMMAVGATYAYFTARTNSQSDSVRTGSTTLQLQYISYESAWLNNDLIPADTNVVEYSFEYQNDTTEKDEPEKANMLCKDDYGNSICSVYVFQVRNTAASPQTVSLELVSTNNTFSSLNAMAYELAIPSDATDYNNIEGDTNKNGKNDPIFKTSSEDETEGSIAVVSISGGMDQQETRTLPSNEYDPIYVNRKGVTKTLLRYLKTEEGTTSAVPSINRPVAAVEYISDENVSDRTVKLADNIEIDSRSIKTFAIVLYIKNENRDQTSTDAAKEFSGQVVVSPGDGTRGVSGVIGLNQATSLQSGEIIGQNPEPTP